MSINQSDVEFIRKTLATNPALTKPHFVRKCSLPAKTVEFCEKELGFVFGSTDERNKSNRLHISKTRF